MPSRSQQRLAAIKTSRSRALLRSPDPTSGPEPLDTRPVARPRSGLETSVGWRSPTAAVAGFAAGVVFWHIVGFWSFVHEAVLHGGRSEIARSASPVEGTAPEPAALAAMSVTETDDPAASDTCALQSRDRPGRHATLRPCRDLSHLTEAAARRWAAGEVRVPAVAGWSAAVSEDAAQRPPR